MNPIYMLASIITMASEAERDYWHWYFHT